MQTLPGTAPVFFYIVSSYQSFPSWFLHSYGQSTLLFPARTVFPIPGFRILGFRIPGFRSPGFRIPGFHIPGFRIPGFRIPGFRIPGFRIPGFRIPGFRKGFVSNRYIRYR